MVTITKTAATNVSFRAPRTSGITLGDEGTFMPAARQSVHLGCFGGSSAGFDVIAYDATRVETTGLPSVATPLGSRAWSPPS